MLELGVTDQLDSLEFGFGVVGTRYFDVELVGQFYSLALCHTFHRVITAEGSQLNLVVCEYTVED